MQNAAKRFTSIQIREEYSHRVALNFIKNRNEIEKHEERTHRKVECKCGKRVDPSLWDEHRVRFLWTV